MHRTKYKLGIEFIAIGLIGLLTVIFMPWFMWSALKIILGLVLILWGIVSLNYFYGQCNIHEEKKGYSLIKGIVCLIFGILLLIPLKQNIIIFIICLIISGNILLYGFFRLFRSHNFVEQFILDIYQYLIAILIILIPLTKIRNVASYIVFGLIILFGLILAIKNKDPKDQSNKSEKTKHEEITEVEYDVEDK